MNGHFTVLQKNLTHFIIPHSLKVHLHLASRKHIIDFLLLNGRPTCLLSLISKSVPFLFCAFTNSLYGFISSPGLKCHPYVEDPQIHIFRSEPSSELQNPISHGPWDTPTCMSKIILKLPPPKHHFACLDLIMPYRVLLYRVLFWLANTFCVCVWLFKNVYALPVVWGIPLSSVLPIFTRTISLLSKNPFSNL